MKDKTYHAYLDSHERQLVIHSLVELKNRLILSVWSSVLQIQRTGGNEIGSRTSDFEKRQVLRRAEL